MRLNITFNFVYMASKTFNRTSYQNTIPNIFMYIDNMIHVNYIRKLDTKSLSIDTRTIFIHF